MKLRRLCSVSGGGVLLIFAACGGAGSTHDVPQNPTGLGSVIELDWLPSAEPSVTSYKIYHGEQPGVYADSVAVSTNIARYTVARVGTHYFAVTALDSIGNESQPSPETSVVVPLR